MRFLLYNIRYGTGERRPRTPVSGYLRNTCRHTEQLIEFFKLWAPDIMGLVEVDGGTFRNARRSQSEQIAESLGHYHAYSSKYADGNWLQKIPVLNKQGNAFITKDSFTQAQFHFFNRGVKRLVIELETEQVTVFLVHLALKYRVRHDQLSDLYDLVKNTEKPHIVAGDFNALTGEKEIKLFMKASGLRNANEASLPSFPSWAPKRHLDFILYSSAINMKAFHMPNVQYSDHLPMVLDYSI